MKTKRKVYYLNYREYQVPMIRLAGKYLQRFGLDIGDSIKVEYTTDQIIITKQKSFIDRKENSYES
jgi:antitoxin component of MazEF toxin-antitoxin module